MARDLNSLMNTYAATGRVEWIGIRPARMEKVKVVNEVTAIEGVGLHSDHYNAKNGSRQVTLIQKEHLDAIASYLGLKEIDPILTRRNIVIMGLNLNSLKGKKFRIGSAVLEYSGECHPCSRMEDVPGPGGYNAMRGHGGLNARILEAGLLRLWDPVVVLGPVPGDTRS